MNNREMAIAKAMIAIAEARLEARKITGDASNAVPTPAQLTAITVADMGREGFSEAKKVLDILEGEGGFFAFMLHRIEGGHGYKEVIAEIRSTLFA
jgi:hypothetical protein